jgi:hypothetical protein
MNCSKMEIKKNISVASCLQDKKITYTIWFLIIAVTVLLSFICLNSKGYLRSNDALYYLSIADNYLNNGVFMDGTTVPNGPVITPQNGIVAIFGLLRMLSFSKQQCLLVVLGINYILLLSCMFPLVQICRRIGLETKELIYCVLFVFVGSIRIFTWLYMSPLNDMFFYAGQLWLLYLLILINEYLSGQRDKTRSLNLLIVASIFLAAIMIHFRLNAIFIPIAGLMSAILLRKYRLMPLMFVLLITMAVSICSSYLIVDRYDFQISTARIGSFWSNYKHQIYLLFFYLLPEGLFKDLNQTGNLLYLPFYLSLLLAFIHGVRQKNTLLLMIFFICCMTFMMTLLHGIVTERYLWVVTIFMYMMLFRIKGFRSIGVLFAASVLLNTIWSTGFDKNLQVVAWENISKEAVLKQENIIVISQDKRSCWYFTDIPSVFGDKYEWQQLLKAKTICIIGPQDYIDNHIKTIQGLASANNHVINSHCIDYGKKHSDLLFCEVSLRGFTQAVEHVD